MDFYNRKAHIQPSGGKPPATPYGLRNEAIKPDQQEQSVLRTRQILSNNQGVAQSDSRQGTDS